MATTFSDIITLAMASKIINDLRWEQDFRENAALFLRQKSNAMQLAIPKFNRPPEMRQYLSFTAPAFDSYYEYVQTAVTGSITVQTGAIGYELCNVGVLSVNQFNEPDYTPVTGFSYNDETGDVTITGNYPANTEFQFDFYTDGVFDQDLNYEIQEILCYCLAMVWETGFSGEWLNRTPILQDKTFKRASTESAWTEAQEHKRRAIETALNDRLMKYEQNAQYRQVVINKTPNFEP